MLNPLSKEKLSALHVICCSICALFLIFVPAAKAEPLVPITPLIENIRELHCASDELHAQTALNRLKNNFIPLTGLPDEWEGKKQSRSSVYAGTVDLAISTIISTAEEFPKLRALSESVIFRWNYCQVFHNGGYFDINTNHARINTTPAEYSSPSHWRGLSQLGLGGNSAPRYQPLAFTNTAGTARDKLLYNWWNLQRNQCLPHPATGTIFHRKQYVARAKVNKDNSIATQQYPQRWNDNCAIPLTAAEIRLHKKYEIDTRNQKTAALTKIRMAHSNREWKITTRLQRDQKLQRLAWLTREKARSPAPALSDLYRHTRIPVAVKLFYRVTQPHTTGRLLGNTDKGVEMHQNTSEQSNISDSQHSETRLDVQDSYTHSLVASTGIKLTESESTKNALDLATRYKWYKDQLGSIERLHTEQVLSKLTTDEPSVVETSEPTIAAANPARSTYQTGSIPPFRPIADPAIEPERNRVYHGLSGSFALSNRRFEDNGWSFTANFSYKPVVDSYFFARTGITGVEGDEPVSYYWGIGYNDWHPGTWAFELNNWGPLNPGDGLKVEEAIASISYKFDSTRLEKYNLSASATVSGGKSSNPALTLAGSWAPKSNWFIRNLVTQPLEGGSTTWAYGFGYNNWRSQTWSLEYNNWGPNTLQSPNFHDNALVTLSWKWNL